MGLLSVRSTSTAPSLQPLTSHCPHLRPSLPGQRLGISPGVSKNLALIIILLLLKQPHLPGVILPAIQRQPIAMQHPPRLSPRIRRARCRLPSPRRPIKIQNLLLDRSDLRG